MKISENDQQRCKWSLYALDENKVDQIEQLTDEEKIKFLLSNSHKESESYNTLTDAYREGLLARFAETQDCNQTQAMKYCAFGTGNSTPASSDTALTNEKFRLTSVSSSNTTSKRTMIYTVMGNDSNTTTPATTVVTDAGNTAQKFKVADTTGFSLTDYTQIALTGGNEYGSIDSIDAGASTIKLSTPLTSIPTDSNVTVKTCIRELGIIGNADAVATAKGAGTLFNHLQIEPPRPHPSTDYFYLEAEWQL